MSRLKSVLGEACRRYNVDLCGVCSTIIHLHVTVTDPLSVLPLFTQDLFRQITRLVQAERPVFDNGSPCVTALLTPQTS